MFLRQGHAAAVVDKKAYIFGGSSGSWFGGEHSESTSDPVYLNDLFVLKSKLLHKVIEPIIGHIIPQNDCKGFLQLKASAFNNTRL